MRDALIPHVRYLFKLTTRMERKGFPPGDELFRLAVAAYDAAQSLATAHCTTCRTRAGSGEHPRSWTGMDREP